jgi:hypothetical protein
MVWGLKSPEVQEMITTLRSELPPLDSPDFQEEQQKLYAGFKEKITSNPSIWQTVIDSVKAKL